MVFVPWPRVLERSALLASQRTGGSTAVNSAQYLRRSTMARPLALLWAAVALALCSSAHSQSYSLQGAAVRIIFPPGYRTTTIDMAMADFGRAEYGASLV